MQLRKIIFVSLLLCALCSKSFAQFEEGRVTSSVVKLGKQENLRIKDSLLGTDIVAGATINQSYTPTIGVTSKKILNIIKLRFDDESSLKNTCTASVSINITGTNVDGTNFNDTKTLQIDFNILGNSKYNPIAYITYNDKTVLNATISTTPTTTGGGNVINHVVIENEMEVTEYFNLTNNSAIFGTINTSKSDGLGISWTFPSNTKNNITQLEWAYVEDEMLGYYTTAGTIDYDKIFMQNSTRVDLEDMQYEIPLLYPGPGKLIYRVRPCIRKNDDNIIVGSWTKAADYSFVGHNDLLNWQSTTSFAENGKRKSIIQYYDGSLRNRQVVTKDNETGNTVVGETIYDLQGRSTVQILPTPTLNNVIQYFKNFNRFEGQGINDDPAKYFDLSIAATKCNAVPRLDSSYGNAKYYSSNNDWLSTENKSAFIPNAFGYAFTETKYTDDATQRVKSQSGIGKYHIIGSGHETKYFYGKPNQQELDALFGTEVGDASHYSKNMVQDANGQMSVSYVDMHGRTIATALAGDCSDNLSPIYTDITNYPQPSGTLTNQLLTTTNNQIKDNSIQSTSTILTPVNTVFNFTYQLNPAILSLTSCMGTPVCYDCKYDLEITLRKEDCGEVPKVRRFNNLKIVPSNHQCDSSMSFSGEGLTNVKTINFSETLSVGSWVITKTLTINDSAWQERKRLSLDSFLCKTEQTIYDSVLSILQTQTGCGLTPSQIQQRECDSCKIKLGTYANYKLGFAGLSEDIIRKAYIKDSLDCVSACGKNAQFSTLATIRRGMLNDMIPFTGQYATQKITNADGNEEPKLFHARYNIFATQYYNGNTPLSKLAFFRNPSTEESPSRSAYLDEQGNVDNNIQPLLATISPVDFTQNFDRSWANSLIKYHPEYSKLQMAETVLKASYQWLDDVMATETYAEATTNGYLNPLGTTNPDPFYTLTGVSKTKVTNKMNNGLTYNLATGTISGSDASFWQIANASVACTNIPEADRANKQKCIAQQPIAGIVSSFTTDAEKANTAWESFKSQYLSFRNEEILSYINNPPTGLINPNTGNPFVVLSRVAMDSLKANGKLLAFATAQDIADQNGWTYWNAAINKDTNAVANHPPTNTQLTDTVNRCKAQWPLWKAKLLQCDLLKTLYESSNTADSIKAVNIIKEILAGMDSVCNKTIDATDHPNGASTNPFAGSKPTGFESVINRVFAKYNLYTNPNHFYCNPFTIDYAKPYDGKVTPQKPIVVTALQECNCEKYTRIKDEITYVGGYDLTSLMSVNKYLKLTYNDTISASLWQALQKCDSIYGCKWIKEPITGNVSLSKWNKNANKLAAPIYQPHVYHHHTKTSVSKEKETNTSPRPMLGQDCEVYPIVYYASYINNTNIDNIKIAYSITGFCTGCNLIVRDIKDNVVAQYRLDCKEKEIVISLPPCKEYKFSIACGDEWMLGNETPCGIGVSNEFILHRLPDCECISPIIKNIKFINYDGENVYVEYISNSHCKDECKLVITDLHDNLLQEIRVDCNSNEIKFHLEPCNTYKIRLECNDEICGYQQSSTIILYPHPECKCEKPVIKNAIYVNNTNIDNIEIDYITIPNCNESCILHVLDRRNNEVESQYVNCGRDKVTLSLPECEPYKFVLECFTKECGYVFSDTVKVETLPNCACKKPIINAVNFIAAGDNDNILVDYTSSVNCNQGSCFLIATDINGKQLQSIYLDCNAYQQVLSLPNCTPYTFYIICYPQGCSNEYTISDKVILKPVGNCECPKPYINDMRHIDDDGTIAINYTGIANCVGDCKLLISNAANVLIDSLDIPCSSLTTLLTFQLPTCQKYNFVVRCNDAVCGNVFSQNYFLDKNASCNNCDTPKITYIGHEQFNNSDGYYRDEFFVDFTIPAGINCGTCKIIIRDSITRDTVVNSLLNDVCANSTNEVDAEKYFYTLDPCRAYIYNVWCPSPSCGQLISKDTIKSAIRNCDSCKNPVIRSVTYSNVFGKHYYHINYNTNNTNCSTSQCWLHIRDKNGYELFTGYYLPRIDCNKTDYTIELDSIASYQFYIECYSTKCNALFSNLTLFNPSDTNSICPKATITGINYIECSPCIVNSDPVTLSYTIPTGSVNCYIDLYGPEEDDYRSIPIACNSNVSEAIGLRNNDDCIFYAFVIRSSFVVNGKLCTSVSKPAYKDSCISLFCTYYHDSMALPQPVVLPMFLTCNNCITCNKFDSLTAEFKTIFPAYSSVPYLNNNTTQDQIEQNNLWARFINFRTGFSKAAGTYIDAYYYCLNNESPPSKANALCNCTTPVQVATNNVVIAPPDPCKRAETQANFWAKRIVEQRKEVLIAKFDSLYKAKCLSAQSAEVFYATYVPKEYHYTLYYYDQAGNLVKTLPPAAVKPNYNSAFLTSVENNRAANTFIANANNNENLATLYYYNTLNQVVKQKTPDAGESNFWYDVLGRLVVSQNAKQADDLKYSYTLYDWLGRITEVGQIKNLAIDNSITKNTTNLTKWLTKQSPYNTYTADGVEQVTRTEYDLPYFQGNASVTVQPYLYQKNLRNRVSATMVFSNVAQAGMPLPGCQAAATYYSYDIHGNVDSLLQDFGSASIAGCAPGTAISSISAITGQRYKKIVYNYDLISGKVNMVSYQPNQDDQFYHRYKYDAENRLTKVETSLDKIYWEEDATYSYYRHGPLSRTILGQNKVQGLDYAYTLQGWLKGVNSTAINKPSAAAGNSFDMGKDGTNTTTPALDAYSYSLNYYTGDFKQIGTVAKNAFATISINKAHNLQADLPTGQDLFNGNIKAMLVNIPQLGDINVYGYRYDQLNRIVAMNTFAGFKSATNLFTSTTPSEAYREHITYDPNGNILTYRRNDDAGSVLDSLTYQYPKQASTTIALNNKLRYVHDEVATAYADDIESQTALSLAQVQADKNPETSTDNYSYDKIGNLIKDTKQGINAITWTVYGKIESITKTSGAIIKYAYDASGNRISKIVTTGSTVKSTYYVRDASGNTMAVYTKDNTATDPNLQQTEITLYGSSRLGLLNTNRRMENAIAGNGTTQFMRGSKNYELTNHLGNVLVTISDRKLGVDFTRDGIYDYYIADIVTATDYYPFGMQMPGRIFAANSSYRYGFNGQEKSDEIADGLTTALFWEYDSRIGRRWNTDPEVVFNESLYSTFKNNPIRNSDYLGDIPWDKILVGIDKPIITSTVKMRLHPVKKMWRMHKGVDIAAAIGTSVRSFASGTVIKADYDKNGGGYYVAIQHANGYVSKYLHLKKGSFLVKKGDVVSDGQNIAESGNTGIGSGPHLHLQVEKVGADGKKEFLKANEIGDLQNVVGGNENKGIVATNTTPPAQTSVNTKPQPQSQSPATSTNSNTQAQPSSQNATQQPDQMDVDKLKKQYPNANWGDKWEYNKKTFQWDKVQQKKPS